MHDVPDDLLRDLDAEARHETRAWWATLDDDARLEFVRCWDARSDDTALHGVCHDGQIEWHALPLELRGRIVDEEDRIDDRLARQQLLEFVNNQPEIQFFLVERKFHICRSHVAATACLRSGVIPRGFRCPAGEEACPMARILAAAGGRSVELVPGPMTR
jgi:hypothetical protein